MNAFSGNNVRHTKTIMVLKSSVLSGYNMYTYPAARPVIHDYMLLTVINVMLFFLCTKWVN
jgi:hypothetical protein